MVDDTLARWGRIDIREQRGILRDKTFGKMSLEDFRAVVEVHLMGSVVCTKAVWDIMRSQGYGRIVMTTSSRPLRQLRQRTYSAAKMALVGFDANACARRRETQHPSELLCAHRGHSACLKG